MSNLVEIWVNGLAKLGERSRARVASRGKAGEKLQQGGGGAEEEARQKEAAPRTSQAEQRPARLSTLSEATVCMLMDRFAPC